MSPGRKSWVEVDHGSRKSAGVVVRLQDEEEEEEL
jgi:hypothetical protein